MYTILGGGKVGYKLAKMLLDRGSDVVLVEKDPERVRWLERLDIEVVEDDMRDVTLERIGIPGADMVLVVGDDQGANMTAIHRIRKEDPDVFILARSSEDRSPEDIRRLGADVVVHVPERISAAFIKEIEEYEITRLSKELVAVLKASRPDGMGIFCHDNPDPDTLASGWALYQICRENKVKARIYFGGDLVMPSSKELVRRMRIPITGLSGEEEVKKVLEEHSKIALVDSARAGENNCLPGNVVPNVIVDHHSTSASVKGADFHEIRGNVGATSTIMTKYFLQLGLPMDVRIATALFYGIKTDTANFTKNVSPSDLTAAAYLSSYVYKPLLDIFEAPPIPRANMDAYGTAVTTRETRDGVTVAYLGDLSDRSALPFVVDFLMQEEGVETAVGLATVGETIQLSARNKDKDIHIGELLHRAFKDMGSAGGHATSAGGQLPLDSLQVERPDEGIRKVRDMLFRAIKG